MTSDSASSSHSWLGGLVDSFRDTNLGDELLWHLTSTVYGNEASLFASIIMGAAATFAGWGMTFSPVFPILLAGQLVIAIARLRLLRQFKIVSRARTQKAWSRDLDRGFSFWSTLYAFVLGIAFYMMAATPNGHNTLPLALGSVVGFSINFSTRNAGRFRLFVQQVLAVSVPLIFGLMTLPIEYGWYYAILCVGLDVSTIIMGRASNRKIIEHYRVNETNRTMARFDMLTGSLNRFSFNAELTAKLQGKSSERFALISVDLDDFKEVNDTLGHSAGDRVIIEVAERLRAVVKPDDIVARLGGDEFVILARADGDDAWWPDGFADAILETLSLPVDFETTLQPIGASLGVALYPDHGDTPEELFKRADIALYDAKRSGRRRYRIFDMSMQRKLDDARMLEIEMAVAIREDQFEAWLQPIVTIETGEIVGYEALARWRHPGLGIISPDRFIPVAERTGAIISIGQRILEKACEMAVGWDSRLTIAVNLSPRQFRNPKELVASIKRTVAASRLEPSRLYIEMTESVMLEDTPQTRDAARELAEFGVRFSLDDFGTGYSSLAYIQNYPFSRIKIDRNFINRIDLDDVSPAIIASVCLLASQTRMDVVAEGVETRHQADTLKSFGIQYAQGYLYGRPQLRPVESAQARGALTQA